MIELKVCVGTSCHLRGAEKVVKIFRDRIKAEGLEEQINLTGTFCMGRCSGENVNVSVNSEFYETTPETAELFFAERVAPVLV